VPARDEESGIGSKRGKGARTGEGRADSFFELGSDFFRGKESESSADYEYFRELEDFFIDLRGKSLTLSQLDYELSKEWRRRGIPLELVRRVLRQVFARRKERDADGIVGLRYCRRPVENAWKKARELAAGGERAEPETFDLEGRLDRLAEALPEELSERTTWAGRIRELASSSGGTEAPELETVAMETVEEELGRLDVELLRSAAASLDEAEVREIEEQVDKALARLEERLPAEEVERSRDHLYRRRLRERLELPVLSLFSPAAEGE